MTYRNKRVWKYQIGAMYHQTVLIPGEPQFLSVDVQRGVPVLWALVDVDAEPIAYNIYTVRTGMPDFEDRGDMEYIGTYQLGDFVGHVFYDISF